MTILIHAVNLVWKNLIFKIKIHVEKSANFKYLGIAVWARPQAHVPALMGDATVHGNCLNGDFPSQSGNQTTVNFLKLYFPKHNVIPNNNPSFRKWNYYFTKRLNSNDRFLYFLFFLSFLNDKEEKNTTHCPYQNCTIPSHDICDLFFTENPIRVPEKPLLSIMSMTPLLAWSHHQLSSTEPRNNISVTRPNRPWPDRL